jgi:hypothetical protein
MLKLWSTLFAFLVVLTACSHVQKKRDYTYLQLPYPINKDESEKLSASQVREDVEQALFALERAYAGAKFLPSSEFANLEAGFKKIIRPTSVNDLCWQMGKLMDAVSDSHLASKFNNKRCFASTHDRKGQVGSNFYQEKNEIPWSLKLEKKNGKRALLISVTSFPSSTSPVWKGFLPKVKELLPRAQFIILDMRGNGGGDDSTGYDLARILSGIEPRPLYAPQWNNPNPEAGQILINRLDYTERKMIEDKVEFPAHLITLRERFVAKRDQQIRGEASPTPSDASKGDTSDLRQKHDQMKPVGKKIYILVDADCASSCESTVDFFESYPEVVLVGENTAGYIHFGNNGIVILKNSGIELRMGTSYNSYVDGRFIEKKGIAPKIQVTTGGDAMQSAWSDFLL